MSNFKSVLGREAMVVLAPLGSLQEGFTRRSRGIFPGSKRPIGISARNRNRFSNWLAAGCNGSPLPDLHDDVTNHRYSIDPTRVDGKRYWAMDVFAKCDSLFKGRGLRKGKAVRHCRNEADRLLQNHIHTYLYIYIYLSIYANQAF